MRTPRWLLLLGGAWALVRTSLAAFGGYEKLWLFGAMEQHRFTAMAILTGTLRLRNGLDRVQHDEQVYNGAGYTNWGFGVPLLQAPFHALAFRMRSMPARFFPDRTIYFFFLAAMIPVLWAAFDRLLAMHQPADVRRVRRHVLSWCATMLVLVSSLFPLMASRFYVYEETICYLMIFEFFALSAYVFALRSWGSLAVVGMGVASGIGLLVRPTGLIYVGVWGLLALLDTPRRKPLAVFAATVAPFLGLWSYTNWVRSGTPVGLGLSNSLPHSSFHFPMLRFGSQCLDTRAHALEAAARLFSGLFFAVTDDARPWMKMCHFDFERRPPDTNEPFLGVVVLIVLAGILVYYGARRERRPSSYVPFAAIAFVFASYVAAGAGFSWRYVGDFWPLVVLACVQCVRALPAAGDRFLGWRLALVLATCSFAGYLLQIAPNVGRPQTLNEVAVASEWDSFTNSRWSMDKEIPSRLYCGVKLNPIYRNGEGWGDECNVSTFTNVFVGVPFKDSDQYEVRFKATDIAAPTLRVYVNGRIYTAHPDGDTYKADVVIHQGALTSPAVMVTIEWSRDLYAPPQPRLLFVEIG